MKFHGVKIACATLDMDVEIAGYDDLAFVERYNFKVIRQLGEERIGNWRRTSAID